MLTKKRRLNPGVAQRLLAEPHRFQFFQAIRILERVFVRNGVRPADVVTQKIHFRNSVSMGFPTSEIAELRGYTDKGTAWSTALADEQPVWGSLSAVDVTPAFMGMLGGSGVLPFGYTERIAEREAFHRDHAAREFLDIFNNRAVALFYAAWKKHRLAFQYELDRKERFLPLILSLTGMGTPALRAKLGGGKGAVFDQAIAYYSAAIAQRPMSAATVQRILCEYFSAQVRVEQFVGAWYAVPENQHTRLGTPCAVLGRTALAGGRVWQRDLRLRLWIGPLRHQRFEDFLPGSEAAAALAKWLTLLLGSTLEYEVQLVLDKQDVQPTALSADGGGRLGWDAFMCTRPAQEHRTDANYLLQTMA
ncbi:MAG: type VI secretion system baseplate subunit TssG [Rhodanobacter sp.]